MKILQLAQPEDWAVINDLCRQAQMLHAAWRPDIFENVETPYPEEYLLEDIEAQAIFIAKIDGNIVGCVRCYTWSTNGAGSVPSKVLDIDDITVDEKYRHCGIGQRIMEDVREIAKERGCNDIQLSVYPENESAVRFYERCGFQIRNIRYQMYI